MTTDSRRRLGALTALVAGLFLGLTLLPVGVTGPVGGYIGHALWQLLGAGALGIPLLGLGLALAGFDRLGGLDMKRSALLIVGLSVLVPYVVGVLTHVRASDFDWDVGDRALSARAVGWLPGFLAVTIADKIGVAGAVLLGFLALSALTLATFAWHPLQRLERGSGTMGPADAVAAPPVEDEPEPKRRRKAPPCIAAGAGRNRSPPRYPSTTHQKYRRLTVAIAASGAWAGAIVTWRPRKPARM